MFRVTRPHDRHISANLTCGCCPRATLTGRAARHHAAHFQTIQMRVLHSAHRRRSAKVRHVDGRRCCHGLPQQQQRPAGTCRQQSSRASRLQSRSPGLKHLCRHASHAQCAHTASDVAGCTPAAQQDCCSQASSFAGASCMQSQCRHFCSVTSAQLTAAAFSLAACLGCCSISNMPHTLRPGQWRRSTADRLHHCLQRSMDVRGLHADVALAGGYCRIGSGSQGDGTRRSGRAPSTQSHAHSGAAPPVLPATQIQQRRVDGTCKAAQSQKAARGCVQSAAPSGHATGSHPVIQPATVQPCAVIQRISGAAEFFLSTVAP